MGKYYNSERVVPENSNTDKWVFHLFIAGEEPNSVLARRNFEEICKDHLAEPYDLYIVDVFEDATLAREYNVLVTPALRAEKEQRVEVIAGNLNNRKAVLRTLDLS